MVSYEAWGTLYLRLAYRPRLGRLAVSALGIALALLLHPFAAAAIGGLLAILLLEGWIFARKVRRALTEDPKEGSVRVVWRIAHYSPRPSGYASGGRVRWRAMHTRHSPLFLRRWVLREARSYLFDNFRSMRVRVLGARQRPHAGV